MKRCVICNKRYAKPREYITCEAFECQQGYNRYKAQRRRYDGVADARTDIRVLRNKIQQVGNWKKQIASAQEYITITKRLGCG